jgi:serine/threonine-protein kinase
MRTLHEGDWTAADAHFARVVALDATLAVAHLRLSMTSLALRVQDKMRAEYRLAVELRASLTERDQALLDALEPILLRQPQDRAEVVRRLQAMADRDPSDVESRTWLGMLRPDGVERLQAAARALALDLDDLQSYRSKGRALSVLGRADEARAAFERCTQVSSRDTECLSGLAALERIEGRCDAYLAAAERISERAGSMETQIAATVAAGRSLDEAHALLVKELAARPPADRAVLQARFDLRSAMLAGDFAAAARSADEEGAALDAHPTERAAAAPRRQLAAERASIALEIGDDAAARAAARDFVAHTEPPEEPGLFDDGLDVRWGMARLAVTPGGPLPPGIDAGRPAWIAGELARGIFPGQVWVYAYASAAQTSTEAETALSALVQLGPPSSLPGHTGAVPVPDAVTGHAYLLARRPAQAIPWLRRASASCTLFDATRDKVRSALDLGAALEAAGDKPGACSAYGQVLAIWGRAGPRSVSADQARERVKALGCGAMLGAPGGSAQ